ncbi:MAG: hypothetical protein A2908_02530 [Candidatus Staskawiczbacteria bacterium RIFCSPLOWO2_01_FULL_38_12b]|uniref:Thioredoxin-like fold domain-containing protein n=1 Tax=Candidatus Staskawiczbacteria bacterium RIFCSPLOWO2_01_FULL_38_12b TaxID=1802214 RepID=A0A1G2IAX4_9BACT|nr:MAG: hypothetical protein A2908_02530 [Candidatus Staskawiczbacteria bacterium RIFCSPLOWO2_01_FULL_38_12b]
MFKINKNSVLLGVAVLGILMTGILMAANANMAGSNKLLSFLKLNSSASVESIAQKAVGYLNESVLQEGQTATLVSAVEESGVIKFKIQIAGKDYDSYVSKDGKLLFPEGISVDLGIATQANQPLGTVTPVTVAKVQKTSLEAYVVSACPYGLQMQRALSNAIKAVPSLAEYVKVRYIGAVSGNIITAMHGDEEAKENARQIGIREEQPDKYWPYVSCYMEKATGKAANGMPYGDTEKCQQVAGVDVAKLDACIADPNRCLAYAKEDFALNAKYGIQGSPTLVLNGAVIAEKEFGGRSADAMRNIVCSSSLTLPGFCSEKLDTTPAATSFSVSYAPASSAIAASASTSPACAPVAVQ